MRVLIQHFHISGLIITKPPQNDAVCIGDEVNITCGYIYSVKLAPVWKISGQTFSVSNIAHSSLYNAPLVDDSEDTLLTVYSATAKMNGTTFQCEFTFRLPTLSSIGKLTVMGKSYTELGFLRSGI